MRKLFLTFCFFTFIYFSSGFSQTNGNIPLHFKSKFDRYYGAGDVWGVKINNVDYALVTLDGGLSIVNTEYPANPDEIAHINHTGYDPEDEEADRLGVPDVETFVYTGTTYAYLATNIRGEDPPYPLVIIINVNAAINKEGEILFDPINDTPHPDSVFAGKIEDIGTIERSHTLTIAGIYLYVATLNDLLPVWKLNPSPTNPWYLGSVTLNPSESHLHEMFVKPTGANSARVYAACVEGGLQVLELSYVSGPPPQSPPPYITVNSRVEHLYDFDRAYPDTMWSGDPYFDYRFTHSAWPTDDEQYVFTTDELALQSDVDSQYSARDPNLYSTGVLKTPRREGTFLRTWKRSLLTQNSSFKGGYYVSEESPWGITDLTQIDTNWVPNTIHQMFVKGSYMYVSHYSQGFRMLDISDPENIIELGYYDDYPGINFSPASSYFFRKRTPGIVNGIFNWASGVFGIFPDANRSTICYGGGTEGLYIFDVTPLPYPPTNLTIDRSEELHPLLEWNTSDEESNIDHFNIYKRSNSSGFQLFDETQNEYYEDTTETVLTGGGQGHLVWYYVTAVTVSEQESNASNRVSIEVDGIVAEEKRSAEGEEEKEIFKYSLSDNYPNPFNPSTQINFTIKSAGLVTLKVYDILGTEVATLVNEMKDPGRYSIEFSASTLSSGVYIYKLNINEFASSKKLILLK